jgi:hypothetical protein
MLYFCNFQNASQSKQPANGRKFAQSGHPAESYNEFGGGTNPLSKMNDGN